MRQGDNILVSVIIPAYNQGAFLAETLDCVLSQMYENWECIIVNDGSTDNTEEVARVYCEEDKRFKYIKQDNQGVSATRNVGMQYAKGEYIQFLDADDLIDRDKIRNQVALADANDADVVVARYTMFEDSLDNIFDNEWSVSNPILHQDGFLYEWGNSFVIAIHAGLFRRDFLAKHNIDFPIGFKGCEDWFFWVRLSLNNASFFLYDKVVAYYRVHDSSATTNRYEMQCSRVRAPFALLKYIPKELHEEFIMRTAEKQVAYFQRVNVNHLAEQRANSIDYRVGYYLLWPLHRISSLLKRLLRK